MNYYLDTEFIERPGSIQLISIGIIDEFGKHKYYAISSEFDPETASDWVKENVIAKLEPEDVVPRKTIEEIKKEVIAYLEYTNYMKFFEEENKFMKIVGDKEEEREYIELPDKDIKFWAYYADYDWVVFCWIFGTMMDLPKGMPMYCRDLKQEVDLLELPKQLYPSKQMLDKDSAEAWLESEAEKETQYPILSARYDGLTKEKWMQKKRNGKKYASFVIEEHNAAFDANWNRLLHRAAIVYEQQKQQEKQVEEWEDLSKEMEMALKTFEKGFNDNNDSHRIELTLKLHNNKVFDNEEGFIEKAALVLSVKETGHSPYILISKVFGFRNETQIAAKYDWALKLYREMLYEITGACITLGMMREDARRQQPSGNIDSGIGL